MLNLPNPMRAGAAAQRTSHFASCCNTRPVRDRVTLPRLNNTYSQVKAEHVQQSVKIDRYSAERTSSSTTFKRNHVGTIERLQFPVDIEVQVTVAEPKTATDPDSSKRRQAQLSGLQRTVTRHVEQVVPMTRDLLAQKVHAIILAGGESSIPIADHSALAAVPLGGSNLNLVDVPINSLITSGVNKLYVLAQYNSYSLLNHVARCYPPKFNARGESYVDVVTCSQTTYNKSWYRGAAEAVSRNLAELFQQGGELPEYFVITSGSALLDVDFLKLVQAHENCDADITLLTICVNKEQAQRSGVVTTDATGNLTHFVEKPAAGFLDKLQHGSNYTSAAKPFEVSMGVYIFKRDVLKDLLSFPEAIHFGHDVIPAALSSGYKVVTTHHAGFWKDITCLRDYYEASMTLTAASPPLDLIKLFENSVQPMAQAPAKFHNAMIDSCVLGGGVLIKGSTVTRSIVGNNIYIAEGCNISDSLLIGNEVFPEGSRLHGIGENTTITKAIIDSNASIGKNVEICNRGGVTECNRREEGFVIRDGIVVVLKNATIADGTVI